MKERNRDDLMLQAQVLMLQNLNLITTMQYQMVSQMFGEKSDDILAEMNANPDADNYDELSQSYEQALTLQDGNDRLFQALMNESEKFRVHIVNMFGVEWSQAWDESVKQAKEKMKEAA